MRNETDYLCHDCGISEGELHRFGCKKEKCPFCGGYLAVCGCHYKKLGFYDRSRFTATTNYLPVDIYENGLSKKLKKQWLDILNNKRRVPYIYYPKICCKCGAVNPKKVIYFGCRWEFFIELSMQDKVICDECFGFIYEVIIHKTLHELTPMEKIYEHLAHDLLFNQK